MRLDSEGNLYATGSPFSLFNTRTHAFIDLPSLPKTYGLTTDTQGNAWFTAVLDSSLGTVSSANHAVRLWKLPTKASPQHIVVGGNGDVWLSENATGKLTKFSPSTGAFTDYALPGPSPTPYALTITPVGSVWYTSTDQDTVGALDPASGKVVEYPFPHSEAFIRELFPDAEGRVWFTSPPNHSVGYFYLAPTSGSNTRHHSHA